MQAVSEQAVRTKQAEVEKQPGSKNPGVIKTKVDELGRRMIMLLPGELEQLADTVHEWLTF